MSFYSDTQTSEYIRMAKALSYAWISVLFPQCFSFSRWRAKFPDLHFWHVPRGCWCWWSGHPTLRTTESVLTQQNHIYPVLASQSSESSKDPVLRASKDLNKQNKNRIYRLVSKLKTCPCKLFIFLIIKYGQNLYNETQMEIKLSWLNALRQDISCGL